MKRILLFSLVIISFALGKQGVNPDPIDKLSGDRTQSIRKDLSYPDNRDGARYLIITNDLFYNAIQPLANWKIKKGVPTKVVPLSIAGNNPTQIKNYILNAYNTWNPRPEYILLVGSGTRLPNVGTSDDYYADLTGVGNPLIELSVGRFPCVFASQCSTIVAKTLNYERTPFLSDSSWFRKGATIVDEDPEAESVYWADARYIHSLWRADNYLHIDSFSYLRGNTTTDVMNAINDGRAYVAQRGEATVNWWHFAMNPDSLNNGDKLPIVISATCATMSLTDTSYLGDKFLITGKATNPKGAVGFFGTTIATSGPGLGRLRGTVATGFFRSVFQDHVLKLGDATKRAKFILDSIRPPYYNDTRYKEWNLFGDPELAIYTGVPKPLTVLHDTIIQTGPQNYNVTVRQAGNPVTNALVCVMMDSTIYQYGYTNGTGNITFNIYSPCLGTMSVTVTAQNYIPYEKNVQILPGGNVHDIAVSSIITPQGTIVTGSPVVPKVQVRNWGGYTDTFDITFRIGNVYNFTVSSVILSAGDTATISFPTWNSVIGDYAIIAYISLSDDQWHTNDTARAFISVITPNDVGVEAILNPDTTHSLNRVTIPRAKIKNYGILTQTNFPVVCSIIGRGGVLRYSNMQTISSLNGNDTMAVNFAPWTPTIIETCNVKISTYLSNDENSSNDRKIRTSIINEGYMENFEEYDGNYHTSPLIGGWEWGVPNSGPYEAHSGMNCWATVLNGNYPISANWKLTSNEFTATTNNPTLKFWHWYQMDDFYDGGNVKISIDSGMNWLLLHPQGGYPGSVYYFNNGIPNESCYTGLSDWTEASFTLPVLAGQHFFIRWHFGSSPYTTGPGWYIDDVSGIGFSGQTPLVNDVGVDSIIYPLINLPLNTYLQPSVLVKNFGILRQVNFPVACSIINTSGVLRYTNTKTISLSPGIDTVIYFASWLPTTTELCSVKMRTGLTGDENLVNNRLTRLCEIRWILFNEDFEGAYFPPTGWVIYNNDSGSQIWVRGTANPHGSGAYAESRFESSSLRNDDWLVTPAIAILSASTDLRFWYRAHTTGNYESLQVRLSTTGNAINDFTIPLTDFRFNNTTYLEKSIPFNGYLGQNIYIAFINKGLFQRKIYLDDIMIKGFTTGITEAMTNSQPIITMLYPIKPNPANQSNIHISFSLAEPTQIRLKIYDASGRLIKNLVNHQLGRGIYNFNWNGKDENNHAVAEGVYFYSLETPKQSFTKKMVFTK
jgi:hypothetical protein